MNVIFGPAQQQHIKPLAAFAKKNDIRLVIPFSSKEGEVFNNPFIYQINTPQSYLYSEVYEHFTRQFPNANVILLESAVVDKDKVEFIKGLKQELGSKGIPVKTLKENAPVETLKAALHNDKENFFIPTSGNDLTLLRIIPQLTLLVRDNPEARIHLFGYPEWQTYTKDHLESFFELDTYFTRHSTRTIYYRPPSTSLRHIANGTVKRWRNGIRSTVCWALTLDTSSLKDCLNTVPNWKRTFRKWI